jgi:hypothetical protein
MLATNFNGEPSGYSLSGLGSSLTGSGSSGLPLSLSYTDKYTINTPPPDYGSNKIKEGDTSISNLEQMRQAQDAQMGIGGNNPFLKPIN